MEVNIHQAKTHLSRLLQKLAEGEEVVISRAGVPVAKLIAVGPTSGKRPLGFDHGRIWMAEDFDAPMPELEGLFYNAPITTPSPRRKNAGKKNKKRTR